MDRAAFLVLSGQMVEAFEVFDNFAKHAITHIYFENWVDLLGLTDHPRGQKLLGEYYAHLNVERAKLDLPL